MKRKGPWTPLEIDRFVESTFVPIRLACNGSSGHPVLASLWYVARDGILWCATQRNARIAALLSRDPRCAFEISEDRPPYRGVRGRGIAHLHDGRGEEVLRALIERYDVDPGSPLARWLLGRVERETAIALEPQTLVSWDYTDRMGGGS